MGVTQILKVLEYDSHTAYNSILGYSTYLRTYDLYLPVVKLRQLRFFVIWITKDKFSTLTKNSYKYCKSGSNSIRESVCLFQRTDVINFGIKGYVLSEK